MNYFVFDTNIVSGLLKLNPQLMQRLAGIVTPENVILGCPVVWYEVRRGLLEKGATVQMRDFEILFSRFVWQHYTLKDWSRATELWVKRRKQGMPVSDADLLIAVFALNRNATLVTNNEKDFAGLGVTVENWLN